VQKIALVHNALVYDALRNRYYASIPGSVVGSGNSIAAIDPATGAVSYSAAVGSEPFALGLAADGSALYVGLNGSGEVIRLSLPGLQELSRTRLPVPAFFGQLLAENIAVSPIDPNVVAVSTWRVNSSPRHGGVVLIRSGVLQPRMTQDHTGSNLIAFDATGQFVYGLNNETTEFGLRRIELLADGLAEQVVVSTDGGFGVRALDHSASGLVLDRAVYRSPDLALLGRVAAPSFGCRAHAVPNRLVCMKDPFPSNGEGRLVVVDATSFVIQATPAYAVSGLNSVPTQLVAGPVGQVALRFDATFVALPGSALWLFTSPALQ
jgi:DNA-binding beta-propeller fold protein YncE